MRRSRSTCAIRSETLVYAKTDGCMLPYKESVETRRSGRDAVILKHALMLASRPCGKKGRQWKHRTTTHVVCERCCPFQDPRT